MHPILAGALIEISEIATTSQADVKSLSKTLENIRKVG